MAEPATALSIASGSLTLANAIVKILQEHKKNPKDASPRVAELVAALPAAAMQATGSLINEIVRLRKDCLKAGIDLKMNLDQLREQTAIYHFSKRRVLKTFQARVEGIAGEISILFDDVVSVFDCADRLDLVARSFKDSRKDKDKLRNETRDSLPLGRILDNLQKHAEKVRQEIGDIGRKTRASQKMAY
jgi:hypothetical protein